MKPRVWGEEAKRFEGLSGDLKPRELMERAPDMSQVPDAALLAVILKTGAEGVDVLTLARRLVDAFGSVKAVFSSDWRGIERRIAAWNENHPDRPIKGMGRVKCMELAAAFEIGRRWSRMTPEEIRSLQVTDAASAWQAFASVLDPADDKENLWALPLDNKNFPLCEPVRVARGTAATVPAYARDVFKEALRWGGVALVVAHNHPSGDPAPGKADLAFTERLVALAKIAGIRLLDHLVLGHASFVSIREQSGNDLFR